MKSNNQHKRVSTGWEMGTSVEIAPIARVEDLEQRRMMSAVTFSDGVLSVTGSADASNDVSLKLDATKTRIVVAANQVVQEFNLTNVSAINITGGNQADVVNVSLEIDVGAWIDVGAGDDTVMGGGGNDTIFGGTGNDIIHGRTGHDSINGGDGEDRIAGGRGGDTLHGDAGDDVLFARMGHDSVSGGDGNDVVWGGKGDDTLSGGAGEDNIDGKLGVNFVISPGELDTVNNATPTDTGNDTVGDGTDVVVPAVMNFTLMNADTGRPIRQLVEGTTLDLKTLPTRNLNIIANVATGDVGSVRFSIDGNDNFHVDNSEVFELDADPAPGSVWRPGLGSHTVIATSYSGANATGETGQSKTVNFTVVDTTGANVDPTNRVPTVRIVTPTDNSSKAGPAQYVVRAEAADVDGTVSRVEFYAGNTLLGVTNDAPYSIAWTDVLPGTYTLTARAFDDKGAATTSTVVTVTIKPFTTRNTYYVSPTGSDTGAGNAASPFKTISQAAKLAGAGDTVLIKPGVYRESVWLKNSGTGEKPIVFKAETPGTVVIDGADVVSGWTKESGDVYSADWAYDFRMGNGSRTWGVEGATGYAEQFIHAGKPLTRVEQISQITEGTFAINYASDKVHVWLPGSADARNTTVMGSTRSTLFAPAKRVLGTAAHVRVEGITFRHAANFAQSGQAGVRTDNGWVVVDSTVQFMNGTGMGVFGNDVTVLRVMVEKNGQLGLGGASATNTLVKDTVTRWNNTRNFQVSWEGGGGKWSKTDGVYMLNYDAYENTGHGIWFDIDNTNFVITGSESWGNVGGGRDSEGTGIFIEISPGPGRIENNYVHDNTGAGVRIAESTKVVVQNNTLINNYRGIELRDMPDRSYSVLDVIIRNNKIKGWQESAIGTSQGTWNAQTSRDKRITIENNQYDTAGSIYRIMRWGPTAYSTITVVRDLLGFETTGTVGPINVAA